MPMLTSEASRCGLNSAGRPSQGAFVLRQMTEAVCVPRTGGLTFACGAEDDEVFDVSIRLPQLRPGRVVGLDVHRVPKTLSVQRRQARWTDCRARLHLPSSACQNVEQPERSTSPSRTARMLGAAETNVKRPA